MIHLPRQQFGILNMERWNNDFFGYSKAWFLQLPSIRLFANHFAHFTFDLVLKPDNLYFYIRTNKRLQFVSKVSSFS